MTVKPISPIDDNSKDLSLKVGGDLGDLQISTPSDCEDDDTDRNTEICSRSVDSVSNIPSSLLHTSNAPIFATKKYHIHLWHKVVIIATCVIVVAVVFTLVFLQSKTSKSHNSSSNQESDTSSTTVVGLSYDYLALVTFFTILMVLTMQLMIYPLLTTHTNNDDEQNKHDTSKNIIPDTSQYVDNRMRVVREATNTLIAPNHLRIVSRTDWLAQPPDDPNLDKLRMPVPWVIIAHTATENCYSQTECVLRVRLIQMFHMESRKWDDIGYNFLVGGDGSAYYGRGWDIQGAHTLGYNKYSIGIGFVGTFNNVSPSDKQLEACKKLLQLGVQLGKLSKDYKLLAHRQLQSTLSPGDKLYNIIKTWPHFVNDTSDLSSLIPPY
ncbi:peptidoglycan recognition protein 4-like isoform X2 [Plodia interpunctella]|uniref:peptidoglycan recognition protein 4-like isoform X2 n=1 Tax=Plodia interpunctella TaxID=58824 RepID=UPI002367B02F|nr:peptidoglycan recognition protein 4-like isoform X2 [Plodia interpunctella]